MYLINPLVVLDFSTVCDQDGNRLGNIGGARPTEMIASQPDSNNEQPFSHLIVFRVAVVGKNFVLQACSLI